MQWYYVDGDNRVGPIDDNKFNKLISANKVTSETLVWHEGMTDWQELGTLNTGDSDYVSASAHEQICSQCLNTFQEEDLIRYENFLVCAACKPAFFQKVKEGVVITSAEPSEMYGSVEKGLKGEYDFRVSEVLSEAWELTKGIKRYVIGGTIIVYALSFILMFIANTLIRNAAGNTGMIAGIQLLHQLVSMAVTYPMTAGIMMIGIRRSVGLPISFSIVFSYFGKIIPLFITNILQVIFLLIGFVLLVLPFFYLTVAYCLAMALIIDKNFRPWQALETSRKAVTHRWFKIAGLGLTMFIIVSVSAIPIGIGLIWSLPMGVAVYGVLYRNIFGVESVME
ncbi:MAG: DUF4339 domain-containing protein [Desulfobacteraceae bacterium]|nr:DUF4339 domain-containing protein [Desulfobacteraceae bacterium]